MKSDRLHKWLTLGANFGVLVGLVLLVLEINQNNVLMLAEIEQSRSLSLVDWRRQAALDADFAEIMTRFTDFYNSEDCCEELSERFTPHERTRLTLLATADIYDWENVFAQYQRGLISEEYWQERAVPAIRQRVKMWKEMTFLLEGGGTRQAFKNEVERISKNSADTRDP